MHQESNNHDPGDNEVPLLVDQIVDLTRRVGRAVSHPALWRFLRDRRTRYVLAWLMALSAAATVFLIAWMAFDSPKDGGRRDGNGGHTTIDFGGQYLMGRMLVRGYGAHLYHRAYQRRALQEVYPLEDQDPDQNGSDAENLMTWMMGTDDALANETNAGFAAPLAATSALEAAALCAVEDEVRSPRLVYAAARAAAPLAGQDALGETALLLDARAAWRSDRMERVQTESWGGPLYPPINAYMFYPLARLSPRVGYRVAQILNLVLVFVAGLIASALARGRVWWPVATTYFIVFPGFAGSIELAQNATMTLVIVMLGWWLISGGRPVWAGIVWGLLAFKPVWALAFFLVPLLTGRWRVTLAMVFTGVVLAAATLPVVGIHGWREWLFVGREATRTYKEDENWIKLSRDVLTIPRRWFDFEAPASERINDFPAALAGWGLLIAVFELTLRWALFRRNEARAIRGPGAAFLWLGAWLCCFHFMYYDVLLAALPLFLLLTEPRGYLEPILFVFMRLRGMGTSDGYYQPKLPRSQPAELPFMQPAARHIWVLNRLEPTILVILIVTVDLLPLFDVNVRDYPYETVCLTVLWLWCGWLLLRAPHPKEDEATKKVVDVDLLAANSARHAAQFGELRADVGGAH